MWKACVWMIVAAWVTAATSEHPELRCTHPLCEKKAGSSWVYYVEGQKTVMGFIGEELIVECQGNELVGIDSPAMPRFASAVFVPSFGVSFCPPPRHNTYAEALAALNVTLLQTKTQGNLRLHLAPQPPLTARHFVGMEHIISLVVESYKHDEDRPAPAAGFLAPLRSLLKLEVFRIQLPAGEMNHLPASLLSLDLSFTGVTLQQDVLRTTTNLKELHLDESSEVFMPHIEQHILEKKTLRTQMLPSLEIVALVRWKETLPAVLSQCDALREFRNFVPMMKELPDRWVAACPHLNSLYIDKARELTTLPSKLLEGANSLESFIFENGVIETLPEGFFENVPTLRKLMLSNNHLHTLPSGTFMGLRALDHLSMDNNDLEANVQDSLTELYNITELTLRNNKRLGDFCEPSGYSRLVNLKKLRLLDLSETKITHICADWSNLPQLYH